jgi:hypothetical protein
MASRLSVSTYEHELNTAWSVLARVSCDHSSPRRSDAIARTVASRLSVTTLGHELNTVWSAQTKPRHREARGVAIVREQLRGHELNAVWSVLAHVVAR